MQLVTTETLSALRWPIGVRGHALMTRLVRDGAEPYVCGSHARMSLAVSKTAVIPLMTEAGGPWSPLRSRVYINRGALSGAPRSAMDAEGVSDLLSELGGYYPKDALIVSGVDPLFDLGLDAALDIEGALTLQEQEVKRWMPAGLRVLAAHNDMLSDSELRMMGRAEVQIAPVTSTSPRSLHAMRTMHEAVHSSGPEPREPWFSAAIEDDAMETMGVYRNGKLRAYAIFHEAPGRRLVLVLSGCTTEMVGQSQGVLLRLLASAVLSEARRRRRSLVTAADAAGFEALPGGLLGWTRARVYTGHLSLVRRLSWWLFARGKVPAEELPQFSQDTGRELDDEYTEATEHLDELLLDSADPDEMPTTVMQLGRSGRVRAIH